MAPPYPIEKKLLFVEDDVVVRENYAELLENEGFEVDAVADSRSALARARQQMPALALIDISLGTERDGGFQLCAELRQLSAKLPIVFLTSHDSEVDMISGIRLGADDYIIKDPDKLNYLVIRLEALLRRVEILSRTDADTVPLQPESLKRGPLVIDQDSLVAVWKGKRVDLTLTHLWLLQDLVIHPGQARTPGKLMAAAKITVEPNTIAAHVKSIRGLFKAIDPHFDCIRTERGKGYRWLDPVD